MEGAFECRLDMFPNGRTLCLTVHKPKPAPTCKVNALPCPRGVGIVRPGSPLANGGGRDALHGLAVHEAAAQLEELQERLQRDGSNGRGGLRGADHLHEGLQRVQREAAPACAGAAELVPHLQHGTWAAE